MANITLYRPVNAEELKAVESTEWKAIPEHTPYQPIYFPSQNKEFATAIALWLQGVTGEGYILEFEISDEVANKYCKYVIGNQLHQEYWVPKEELETFNKGIVAPIRVVDL